MKDMLKSPNVGPTFPKSPVFSRPMAMEPSARVLFQIEVAPPVEHPIVLAARMGALCGLPAERIVRDCEDGLV
eukprot:SAG11_NODE_4321_length_1949_cov_1.281622_1_plen_73_part_00